MNTTMIAAAAFLSGCITAALLTWLFTKLRTREAVTRTKAEMESQVVLLQEKLDVANKQCEELRQTLSERSGEIKELQAALQAEAVARATAQQECMRIGELNERIVQKEQRVQLLGDTITGLTAAKSELEMQLGKEREASEEKLSLLRNAQEKLTETFKALSSDALRNNNGSFLELAKAALEKFQESARGDLDKRNQAIGELVKPIRESLERFDGKIQDLEKSRVGAYEGLNQQVKSLLETQTQLRAETANLVKALRTPHTMGRWGEIQLRKVVEMAGMVNYCDFHEQQSTTTDEGRLRPDLIVRLPAGKNIVVDAKASLIAYIEAVQATDDLVREQKLLDHARTIRNHIQALGRKSYWEQFQPAPEFVVLFLPGETFFSAALQKDPALIEAGVNERVIVATPTTLIALLKAVAYGWRQEKIAENAQQISEIGKELYKRMSDLSGHFSDLGNNLSKATVSFNKAVGSLESRVLVSARRFRDLESTGTQDEIPVLAPVDITPRHLEAPEMAGKSGRGEDGALLSNNPADIK